MKRQSRPTSAPVPTGVGGSLKDIARQSAADIVSALDATVRENGLEKRYADKLFLILYSLDNLSNKSIDQDALKLHFDTLEVNLRGVVLLTATKTNASEDWVSKYEELVSDTSVACWDYLHKGYATKSVVNITVLKVYAMEMLTATAFGMKQLLKMVPTALDKGCIHIFMQDTLYSALSSSSLKFWQELYFSSGDLLTLLEADNYSKVAVYNSTVNLYYSIFSLFMGYIPTSLSDELDRWTYFSNFGKFMTSKGAFADKSKLVAELVQLFTLVDDLEKPMVVLASYQYSDIVLDAMALQAKFSGEE